MDRFYSYIVTSSILILAIVLLRALFLHRISMRLQYAVWLFAAVKLLVCPVPYLESPLSVQNLLKPWEAMIQQRLYGMENRSREDGTRIMRMDVSGEWQGGSAPDDKDHQSGQQDTDEDTKMKRTEKQPGQHFSAAQKEYFKAETGQIAFWVAAAGSLVMFLYFLSGNLRLGMYLHKKRSRWRQSSCPLPVYIAEGLPSPCLYGRAVYITPKLAADEQRLIHVLAHEYCHYRQGDLIWSLLRCLCLVCCWWNPLVWLAAYLSKQDCELACDEAAVAYLGEDERIAYGRTLLSLVTVKEDIKDCFSIAASMTRGGRNMKRRIQRIARHEKSARSVCVLAVFLTVLCFVSVSTAKPASEPVYSDISEYFSTEKGSRKEDTAEKKADGQEVLAEGKNNRTETVSAGNNSSQQTISAGKDSGQETVSAGKDSGQMNLSAEKDSGQGNLPSEKDSGQGNLPSEKESGQGNLPAEKDSSQGNLSAEKDGGQGNLSTVKDSGREGLEADAKKVITDLDEAVGQAVLSESSKSYWLGECMAEGHIKLADERKKDGHVTVYALTMYGAYEFHDDFFVKESGTGVIPVVMDFSYDDSSGYVLENYQKPMDGGFYLESIHELFPEHLWEACISISDETIAKLTKQERRYAKQYLKKIGRVAQAGDYSDHEHPLLTDAGVSVEVSNKLCELEKEGFWKYPDWIGTRERIEDGVRYVYEMALDKEAGQIVYTKRIYDTGETVERFLIDMYTGEQI